MVMNIKKLKRKHIIIGTISFLLIGCFVYVLAFTSVGYFATIQFRGFSKIQDNIYLDVDYPSDSIEILSVIGESNLRLNNFWGTVESTPTIIISANKEKLKNMGLTSSPALTTHVGSNSFVVISSEGLGIDVVAHELTHAEIYKRLYAGKLLFSLPIPPWFDEGVALQNDYRDIYNENAWAEATDNGDNISDFSEISTPQKFYAGTSEERRYRYIISKHEVSEWIEKNGRNALIALIDNVSQGIDFSESYYAS